MLNLLLPGFSENNIAELEAITTRLVEADINVESVRWPHWRNPEVELNENETAVKLKALIAEEQRWGLIAKSIGTIVGMKLIQIANTKPKYVLLMGLPLAGRQGDEKQLYAKILRDSGLPVFVIQNQNDPRGDLEDLQQVLSTVEYELIIKEASDHRYNYPTDVLKIVERFQD